MIRERDFSTRRRTPRGRAFDFALVGAAGLVLAAAVYAAGSAWAEARRARASYEEVRREIDAAATRIRALEKGGGDEASVDARAVWSVEAPPPRVVAALAEILPPEVRLETIVLRYGPRLEVEMTLTARDAGEYDRFLRALEASPVFDRLVLGDETRTDTVRASIRARYHAGEGT